MPRVALDRRVAKRRALGHEIGGLLLDWPGSSNCRRSLDYGIAIGHSLIAPRKAVPEINACEDSGPTPHAHGYFGS